MPEKNHGGQTTKKGDHNDVLAWQRKLMPWMITLPTILVGAFIFLATIQMNRFEKHITGIDSTSIEKAIPSLTAVTTDSSLKRNTDYIKWYSLVKMEEFSINRRYNQGGVLLMSRIYIKYLGFFTGMILAIVGAVFIISKIKEDVTEMEGTIQDKTKFKLVSSSPGIIFGVLGSVLMMATILAHSEINVKDMPLYLNAYNISNVEKPKPEAKKTNTQNKIDRKKVEEFSMDEDSTAK